MDLITSKFEQGCDVFAYTEKWFNTELERLLTWQLIYFWRVEILKAVNLTIFNIIGSGNGLAPVRRQAIIWTSVVESC